MTIWFTSDVHFFHKNIIRHCNRPFDSVEEMNEKLIENWNSVVKRGDIVWSLGDFSFSSIVNTIEVIKRLNGNLHMVLGNHCKTIANQRHRLLSDGLVKEICDYKELSHNKQRICMFHYAQRTWNNKPHGAWHLFGHTHGSMAPHGKSVDVGVDSKFITGEAPYRPFSLDEIEAFMNTQEVIAHSYDD